MRKRITFACALAFAMMLPAMPLAWQGCATVTGDPVVVRAQQARDFLKETAGAFFDFEYANRAKLLAVSPEIKAKADTFRHDVPIIIDGITATLTTYKAARTQQNNAAVETSTAAANVKLGQLSTEFAKAKTIIPR